jgi:hypothetical protein
MVKNNLNGVQGISNVGYRVMVKQEQKWLTVTELLL